MGYPRRYREALELVEANDGPVVIIPSKRNGINFLHVDCFHCEQFDPEDEDDRKLYPLAAIILSADELISLGYPVGSPGRGES